MLDPQQPATGFELALAELDHFRGVVPLLARLGAPGPVAARTVGAGDQNGAHTLGCVAGQDPAGAGGFVIRMGVNCHEREGVGHDPGA